MHGENRLYIEPARFFDGAFVFLVMFVSFLLIPVLGFYTAVALMVAACYLVCVRSIRPHEIGRGVVFGFVILLFLYLVFHKLMRLRTPSGLFL